MKRLIFFVLSTCLFIMSCGRDLTGPSSGPALGIISEIQLEHSLGKILFVDAQHGWAMTDSSGVFRTTDGGDSWEFFPSSIRTRYLDMSFVNSSTGWICGFDMTLQKTTDGGRTWSRHMIANTADSIFQHVDFINEREGWLFTSLGDVYGTTDGGKNWQLQSRLQIGGLSFVKMWGRRGIVSQHTGSVLETKDGGLSWSSLTTPNGIVGQAFFISPDDGWIIQTVAPYT